MARAGQALVEYLLIIAVVAITLIASLAFLRDSMQGTIDSVPELSASGGSANSASSCSTPGQGSPPPGQGGTAPGQCRKAGN